MDGVQKAVSLLLNRNMPNLSPSIIARLQDHWETNYARWQRRDLSIRHYVSLC